MSRRTLVRIQRKAESLLWWAIWLTLAYVASLLAVNPPKWG